MTIFEGVHTTHVLTLLLNVLLDTSNSLIQLLQPRPFSINTTLIRISLILKLCNLCTSGHVVCLFCLASLQSEIIL